MRVLAPLAAILVLTAGATALEAPPVPGDETGDDIGPPPVPGEDTDDEVTEIDPPPVPGTTPEGANDSVDAPPVPGDEGDQANGTGDESGSGQDAVNDTEDDQQDEPGPGGDIVTGITDLLGSILGIF